MRSAFATRWAVGLTALIGAAAIGTPGAYAADPATTASTSAGTVLVDGSGMTLYVFDKDSAGKSTCTGQCATSWPPFVAPAGAAPSGKFTVVARDDGTHQWAFNGKPLYRWSKDAKPGDATGDNFRDVWHAAKP